MVVKGSSGKFKWYSERTVRKQHLLRRISFTGFQATEDRLFFSAKLSQLYFLASIPIPTRFSFVFFFQNAFYSHQARNSAVQIGLSQYLPETYHFSSVVLHIFFLISLPSSLQTYYTNIIELILQRLE